jgi:4-hydroxythreonine-4-phosphate dehydrogenase
MITIPIGDVTGIGPEVALKAIAAELPSSKNDFLLIGDEAHLSRLNSRLGLGLQWDLYEPGIKKRFALYNPLEQALPAELMPGAPAAARAAMTYLKTAAQLCIQGAAKAIITAPVNKEAIIRSGAVSFVGQTEFLSGLAGTNRTAMMLLGADDRGRWLRVVLVTTHLPLRRVSDEITQAKVELAIELAVKSCHDLGLPRARVGVCGLNPHAGEGGKLGTEDHAIIEPAIIAAAQKKFDVAGPIPADSLFYHAFRGDYDVVVAMYHDQGLGPLKMIGFESGVNWTLGLPFIRTSPDHGTAYDIAGRGIANPSSMQSAIRLAQKLLTSK